MRVEAISVSVRQRNQQSFFDVGSSSVHYFSDDSSLVIGTKKGGIHYYCHNQERNNAIGDNFNSVTDYCNKIEPSENRRDGWSELKARNYKTKYPIYSIAAAALSQKGTNSLPGGQNDIFIFCGSGDRWISVWKVTNDDYNGNSRNENRSTQTPLFEFVQKLGPHTGWVKALVYDDKNRLLHSIGCNCIESWDCSRMNGDHLQRDDGDDPLIPISHIAKRTIENCPTIGTTLSSDLLCLCLVTSTVGSDDKLSRLLVSGGVDGRIHLWISDHTMKRKDDVSSFDGRTPLHTILAHNSRVNAIVYSSAINTIFTVGNDGVLAVFRVSLDEGFELISKLKIKDSSVESTSRLTAVSITKEVRKEKKCFLAVGASNGEIYFISTEIENDGSIECQLKSDHVTVEEGSMIYSLSCQENKGTKLSPRLWVGHATGLVALDIF